MRYESCAYALSWIPSEAVTGASKIVFDSGFTHYDQPPPAEIGDIEVLRATDRFRFANVLRAWAEVDEAGTITDAGYAGGGLMGHTTIRLGAMQHTFQAVQLPDIQQPPVIDGDRVTFTQSVGGRTGLPAPRHVRRPPFVQWQAPLVWTTLSLTVQADGQASYSLIGASSFPRHWVYDDNGQLSHKSGLTDFTDWYRTSFGRHSPWGDEESAALVTAVETALERTLSVQLMHGSAKPVITSAEEGTVLVRQGDPGTDVFLVLDGVIAVERDGERLAEYGPGAMLGERAHLEAGVRTSTLLAVTRCRVAAVPASALDQSALTELSGGHRREEGSQV